MTTLAIRLLLAIAYLTAFLTYFTPAPLKEIQQFCNDEERGFYLPCEWVFLERDT